MNLKDSALDQATLERIHLVLDFRPEIAEILSTAESLPQDQLDELLQQIADNPKLATDDLSARIQPMMSDFLTPYDDSELNSAYATAVDAGLGEQFKEVADLLGGTVTGAEILAKLQNKSGTAAHLRDQSFFITKYGTLMRAMEALNVVRNDRHYRHAGRQFDDLTSALVAAEQNLGKPTPTATSFQDAETNDSEPKFEKQSVWKYILAWFVMGFFATVGGGAIGFLGGMYVAEATSLQGVNARLASITLISAPISILAFYLTYRKIFTSLDPKRVLIWIYALGSIGFLAELGSAMAEFDDAFGGNVPDSTTNTIIWTTVAGWAISLYFIRRIALAAKP